MNIFVHTTYEFYEFTYECTVVIRVMIMRDYKYERSVLDTTILVVTSCEYTYE